MSARITSVGNAGFLVAAGPVIIYVDAFYSAVPDVAAAPALDPAGVSRADIILVTHSHWDHFSSDEVSDVAGRTGAAVVGPGSVIRALRGKVRESRLLALDPPAAAPRGPAPSMSAVLGGTKVTAFRTFHGRNHNSYLVETGRFRFFHDGDNEKTWRVDAGSIGPLDALFIGPWLCSGWVEFVEKLNPARYFLMHMTDEELDQHEAGVFLPEICSRVPPGLTVLRPGESHRAARQDAELHVPAPPHKAVRKRNQLP